MAELMRLPDTELEIMKVIWESGRTLSTSEVKASLEEQRPWNVSALQTLLNRLIDRGFLESYKEGKNRFYTHWWRSRSIWRWKIGPFWIR